MMYLFTVLAAITAVYIFLGERGMFFSVSYGELNVAVGLFFVLAIVAMGAAVTNYLKSND